MLQNGAAFWKLLDDLFITKRGKGYNKTGQLFYYKTGQGLLQNGAAFEVYYKTGQGLLQNGAAFEIYYKTGRLLQNGPLQWRKWIDFKGSSIVFSGNRDFPSPNNLGKIFTRKNIKQ